MKRVLLLTLAFGTLGIEAQYHGRSGVRYTNEGNVFAVRHANDWSQDRGDGRCRVRVRIDDDSDVELRGDQIRIRVLRGAPGRDEGSECNAPLPVSGNIRNFRFRGVDGRGSPRLVQEPSDRNFYVAVVNIQDPQGGDEGYTFDLTWDWDGAGSIFPNRPTTRPTSPQQPGGIFGDRPTTLPAPVGPGDQYLQDMNVSMAGNGSLKLGTLQYLLLDASVSIRNNECRITLITEERQRLEMWGPVNRSERKCRLTGSNRGNADGEALIFMTGSRVTRVNVGGVINGRNFAGIFRSR